MTEEKKEMDVILSDHVQQQMKDDPEMAKAIREFSAMLRQASYGVSTGQYKSLDDAVEAITGSRPVKVDMDEDDFD